MVWPAFWFDRGNRYQRNTMLRTVGDQRDYCLETNGCLYIGGLDILQLQNSLSEGRDLTLVRVINPPA